AAHPRGRDGTGVRNGAPRPWCTCGRAVTVHRAACRHGAHRGGRHLAVRGDAAAARHGGHARRTHRRTVRRPDEAGGSRRIARGRVGGSDPRRAHQPPRPRRGAVPGGTSRRVHGRSAARHPRQARARQGDQQGGGDRQGGTARSCPLRTERGLGVLGVPRRAHRARGAGRGGRTGAPERRAEGTCVAAPRRARPIHQTEGTGGRGTRTDSPAAPAVSTAGGTRPLTRQPAPRQQGHRTRRGVVAVGAGWP
ncbi:MAG: hypothetical protein RJA51_209, partial [Actinomycetota bacterium]